MIQLPFFTLVVNGADGESSPGGLDPILLILILLIAAMMFFTMRRSRKMRERQRESNASAVVGAEVIMAGGMVGTVVSRDEDQQRITIEFSTGDRADFLIGAVQQVVTPAEDEATEDESEGPQAEDPTADGKN